MSSVEINNQVNTVTVTDTVALVDVTESTQQVEVYNGGVGPQGIQGVAGPTGPTGPAGANFTGYAYEIHVSQIDGNDAASNTTPGDLLTPVASITKALTLVGAQRKTIVVHPGTYTENPSITVQYTVLTTPAVLGGNTLISGTVSTSNGCTISGLKMTNLTVTTPTGYGNVNILNCDVSGTFTKSGTADYTLIRFCDIGVTNITGSAGLVAIFGGNPNLLTVNNAGARVIVKNAVALRPVVTLGNVNFVDSIVVAATSTGNALTSAAGTIVTLANSQFIVPAFNNVARVALSGFYSIFNCVYDKPNSTLVALSGTGGSTESIDYFQLINADKFITQGGTSSQFVKGDGSLASSIAKEVITGTAATLNVANIFSTGAQAILTGADAVKGLIIQRNSVTQTANLLSILQSDGSTETARIRAGGQLGVGGIITNSALSLNTDLIGDARAITIKSGQTSPVANAIELLPLANNTPVMKVDYTGAITASNLTDSALTTAGIVTNTSAGLLGTVVTVPVANGGTGVTTSTGTINNVLSNSPTLTGVPTSPTAAVGTSNFQIASTAFVINQASATAPVMDSTATIGTSTRYARADHIHPSDTAKVDTSLVGAANGVASLDGSGLIPTTQLPPLAVNDTFVVASQAAMLALTAQVGDVAVRTDETKTYILQTSPATTLANWIQILTPPAVTSVTASAPLTGGTITSTGTIGLDQTALAITPSQVTGTAVITTDARLSDSRTPSGSASGDLTGTYPGPTLASTGTAGTYTKVTTDAQGRVTSGTTLVLADLPAGVAQLASANAFTVGGHTITNASDVIGLTVRANATQNVSSFEVQNSSGIALIKTSAFDFFVGNNISYPARLLVGHQDTGAKISVVSHNATVVGLAVRGLTGQSANLQEWQDSDTTPRAFIGSGGQATFDATGLNNISISAGNTLVVGTAYGAARYNTAMLSIAALGQIGTVIRGATSQVADLLQFQSSAGTVLGGRNAVGQIFSGSTTPILTQVGGIPTATIYGVGAGGSPTATTFQITLTSASNLAVGDLITVAGIGFTGLTPNGTFVVNGVSNSGTFYVQYNLASTPGTISTLSSATVSAPAQASITARSAGTKGLVVRAAASPQTNVFEVQTFNGAVSASLNQSGIFISTNGFSGTNWIALSDGTTAYRTDGSRNIQFGGGSTSAGSGNGVIGITNATTVPSTNPAGGGVLYEEAGALKHRGSGGLVTTIAGATANSESTFLAQTDFLQSFFGYPASGYDVFPRSFASSTQTTANGTMAFSLFTPVKTVTITTVTNQIQTGRLDYGYTSSYRGIAVYQCSGTNNTTLTPLAVTWDGDKYLWGISQNAPGTTATLTSASASNSGNFTLVTCVGSGASFTSGQWVTITGGTAGSPGFTSFTGTVVGVPSATGWILQRTGTSLVTGTMTGGTVTGVSLTNSTCTITSGSVGSGTGTVATVSIVHSSMAIPFSPGQWVNVTGSTNSFSGVVAESPAPTSTGFTMTAPSTLTSGSVGTGSAVTPDSFGRYVRPLFTPTAGGTGVVTPASITLTAGTRYAIGFLSNKVSGITGSASFAAGPGASSNQLVLPYLALGLENQSTITTAAVTGGTISSFMPWARLT